MNGIHYKKIQYILLLLVFIYMLAQLAWEHFNGGVLSHHLLNDAELPSVSNWWGLLILPVLAWFCSKRIKKRVVDAPENGHRSKVMKDKLPSYILIGFFALLIISIIQSVVFTLGFPNVTMYLALGLLLVGLVLPIYRAECFLGHVLGATFVFGPIIPIIGMTVMATISAVSNLVIKPLVIKLVKR